MASLKLCSLVEICFSRHEIAAALLAMLRRCGGARCIVSSLYVLLNNFGTICSYSTQKTLNFHW